jgi:hypothetical protein
MVTKLLSNCTVTFIYKVTITILYLVDFHYSTVLQINVEDNWRYDFDPFEGYSVKGRSKEPITCNEVMRNNF